MDLKIIKDDYPKNEKIKSNEVIEIRFMKGEDKDKILEFFKKMPQEDKIYLRENVSDPLMVENYWIRRIKEGMSITLLAILKDEIAGESTLHQDSSAWSSHVAHIRLNVAVEHRMKGIAEILAKEIYNIALKLKFEKICAEVMKEQKKIVEIFVKRFGFKEETVLRNHVKDINGKNHDLFILSSSPVELLEEISRHVIFSDIRSGQE